MPANKYGVPGGPFGRREHVCRAECFPIAQVTFFCKVCDNEIFRAQVGSHGRRKVPGTNDWVTWYVCRDCKKEWKDEHEEARKGNKEQGWIKTEQGFLKQGPQGVPSDKTLRDRKKKGRFVK